MAERCAATTKGGKPCGGTPVPGEDLCPWHSPSWAERRRAWSVKGGRGKSAAERAKKQVPAAMGPDELAGWLAALFKGVVAGRIEPKVGTAAAGIGRAMLEATEAGELERRIAALEAAAGTNANAKGWGT